MSDEKSLVVREQLEAAFNAVVVALPDDVYTQMEPALADLQIALMEALDDREAVIHDLAEQRNQLALEVEVVTQQRIISEIELEDTQNELADKRRELDDLDVALEEWDRTLDGRVRSVVEQAQFEAFEGATEEAYEWIAEAEYETLFETVYQMLAPGGTPLMDAAEVTGWLRELSEWSDTAERDQQMVRVVLAMLKDPALLKQFVASLPTREEE